MASAANLQARLDGIIDLRWGEPVELHPWTQGQYTTEGVPDPSRPVIKTTGVYAMNTSRTVALAMAMGGPNTAKMVEADVWASIQLTNIGSLANWKANDRVYWPQRNEWYSINYVAPSATGRPKIYLIRIQANVASGPPPGG